MQPQCCKWEILPIKQDSNTHTFSFRASRLTFAPLSNMSISVSQWLLAAEINADYYTGRPSIPIFHFNAYNYIHIGNALTYTG